VAKGSLIPGTQDRVELNFAGMGELLRSPAIANQLAARMRRVQAALPGSQLQVSSSGRRARVKVIRGSDFDEANTGELGRALDLAGGLRGQKVKSNKPKARKAKT
jgi:hypothetical protein